MSNSGTRYDLSIVIPSYNAAQWLPETLGKIEAAVNNTSLNVEVVIIDDGSTDETAQVVEACRRTLKLEVRRAYQDNAGVFQARLFGAQQANADTLVFVDSRVRVAPQAFEAIESLHRAKRSEEVHVAHTETSSEVPLVGLFWEVPTRVFWGHYHRYPVRTRLTAENFDRLPKGTGFLYCPKLLFLEACAAIGPMADRYVSDDTRLLRFLAVRTHLYLNPEIQAIYIPRTQARRFFSHSYLRGTLFVDSYYGTSRLRTGVLWSLVLGTPIFAVILTLLASFKVSAALLAVLGILLLGVGVLVLLARRNGASTRAVGSFLTYLIPFAAVFWAGLTRGLWRRITRRMASGV